MSVATTESEVKEAPAEAHAHDGADAPMVGLSDKAAEKVKEIRGEENIEEGYAKYIDGYTAPATWGNVPEAGDLPANIYPCAVNAAFLSYCKLFKYATTDSASRTDIRKGGIGGSGTRPSRVTPEVSRRTPWSFV